MTALTLLVEWYKRLFSLSIHASVRGLGPVWSSCGREDCLHRNWVYTCVYFKVIAYVFMKDVTFLSQYLVSTSENMSHKW